MESSEEIVETVFHHKVLIETSLAEVFDAFEDVVTVVMFVEIFEIIKESVSISMILLYFSVRSRFINFVCSFQRIQKVFN